MSLTKITDDLYVDPYSVAAVRSDGIFSEIVLTGGLTAKVDYSLQEVLSLVRAQEERDDALVAEALQIGRQQ